MTQMQNDTSYSDKYLSAGATLDLIEEFILNFPGHKDMQKALEFKKNFTGDIYSFIKKGYISAAAVGDSITRSRITVENRTNSKLIVTIPYGFYLAASDGNIQNMLIREEAEFLVEAGKSLSAYINTLCMDIYKDLPDKTNHFTLMPLGENSPLIGLLKLLEENKSSFEVSQAAAWRITDNPGKERILNTIIYQDGTDAITEDIYNEAMRIVGLLN
jgi:hypothetical protein